MHAIDTMYIVFIYELQALSDELYLVNIYIDNDFKKVVVLIRALFMLNQMAERNIEITMDQSNHFLVLRLEKLRTTAVIVNLKKC